MDANYSLSDLRAITDSADGISGGNAWLIILFLLIIGGGNGFGWNRNGGDYGQYATAASQQDILFSSKFQALDNKIDRIGNGIADATFALNNSIKDTAYATSSAVVTEGRATQAAIADMNLTSQRNVDALRFDMSNYAASINSNIDAKFAAIEKAQLESRIADQAAQINQLQLSAQLCGIPRVNNTAWGIYPYPTCNNGCGCN